MDWFTRENWKMCWYLPTNENKFEIFEHGIKILKMSKNINETPEKMSCLKGGILNEIFENVFLKGGVSLRGVSLVFAPD